MKKTSKAEQIKFRQSVFYTMCFVILLWLIKYTEVIFSADFSSLGILPRTLEGSLGIITSPLVHGDFFHLFSNTFPLLFVGVGTLYFYRRAAPWVFGIIYIVTGLWVWLFARSAYHIGASGLIYGLVSFLFFSGVFRKSLPSVAISLIVVFLYNGMFLGLFPTDASISWETHLTGAVIGFMCAYYFKSMRDSESAPVLEHTFEEKLISGNDDPHISHTYDDLSVNFTYRFREKKK